MKKLKAYFKKILGITALENRVQFLESNYSIVIDLLSKQEKLVKSVQEDNRLIVEQYKMIMRDFSVAADVSFNHRDPSVVLVMRKMHGHKEDMVKLYSFDKATVEEINNFLSRFPQQNTMIDGPRGYPRPRHRFDY